MDTAIQMFKFENKQEIRVVEGNEGEPWFVALDVCKALGLTNPTEAVSALEPDEKNTLRISDGIPGNPNKVTVSESGLYALIFRSNKPEAKRFRKWITSEVLPELRKHGSYAVPGREPSAFDVLEQMFATIKELRGEFGELRYDVCEVRRDVDEIKAAQGKAEVHLLPAQTSDTGYRTVVGYANMHRIRLTTETAKEYGHLAAEWSRKHGYPIDQVPDTRFGYVNAYHIDALDWAFGL